MSPAERILSEVANGELRRVTVGSVGIGGIENRDAAVGINVLHVQQLK